MPFAKERLGGDEAILDLLILCLGAGLLPAMLRTGLPRVRFGGKPIIVTTGPDLIAVLPPLTGANPPLASGLALPAFGAWPGFRDFATNVHGVRIRRPILRQERTSIC